MPKRVALLVVQRLGVLLTDPTLPVGGDAEARQRVFHITGVPDSVPDTDVHRRFRNAAISGPGRAIPYPELPVR